MSRTGVAVLRIRRAHGTPELLQLAVARLRLRFATVIAVGDPGLAAMVGADAVADERSWQAWASSADEVLLADDAWIGPLDDPREWDAPDDGVVRLVEHPQSWQLARGAGIARLSRGSGDGAALHPWAELDLLAAAAPIVPVDPFERSPLVQDAHGLVMPRIADALGRRGFSPDVLARSLAPRARPRDLATSLGLVTVLPDEPPADAVPEALEIVVIMHVHYVDMLDALLERAGHLPPHRLIVTTSDAERGAQLRRRLAEAGRAGEVRVAASNRGRDISAFLIGCRDVLEDPSVDLVVKLHSKRSPQVGGAAGRSFASLLLENLLPGPGHVTRLVELFVRDARLGIAFPPMIHAWYPTLGRAWFTNRSRARAIARRFGISTPLDDASPVAPYGSMFVARPAALRPLVAAGLRYESFPDEGEYRDGSLAHVLERLFVPAALAEGYSFRTVLSAREAAISHATLEHKLDDAEASLERGIARKARRIPWKIGRVARRIDPRR